MRLRDFIIYLFLFCYGGSLTHDIVPHHHHESASELNHDRNIIVHPTEPNKENTDHNEDASPHYLTHSSNIDILVSQLSLTSPAKKEIQKLSVVRPFIECTDIVFGRTVFHPPADPPLINNYHFLFKALRAPPILIA